MKKAPFYSVTPNHLHHALDSYVKNSIVVKTARFNALEGKYCYARGGGPEVMCGGLLTTLRSHFYPHYKDNRSKRRWKHTRVRGSSASKGKQVDRDVVMYTQTRQVHPSCSPFAVKLFEYWRDLRHVPQAAQLPVEIPSWYKLTQADFITMDPDGRLWLWEIKTGAPVGGFRQQGNLRGLTTEVKCTKYNIWQLQLHYTRRALEVAGIPIAESRIIQIYQERGGNFIIKVHVPAEWTKKLPSFSGIYK